MKKINKVLIAYLTVCFFWGSTYLAIKIGVTDFPPFVFAGIRHIISGAIMISIAILLKKSFPNNKEDIITNILVGLFMLLGANGLVVYAEQWMDSSIAALLVSLVPIHIAIIELFIIKTIKFNWKGFIGLGLGFFGVYLLVRPSGGNFSVDLYGAGILVFASLLWAFGSIISTRIKRKDAIIANIGIQMLSGGIGCFIVSLITGGIYSFELTTRVWGALWYLIIFGSVIGFSSYIYVLQHWPATKASTYSYVNPVVAVILGAIILNEPINAPIIMGMIVILLGVFLVQNAKIKV